MRLLAIAAVILVAAGCAPDGFIAGRADISGGPLSIGERTRPASGTDLTIVSATGWPRDHPTTFTVRSGRTTQVTMHLAVR